MDQLPQPPQCANDSEMSSENIIVPVKNNVILSLVITASCAHDNTISRLSQTHFLRVPYVGKRSFLIVASLMLPSSTASAWGDESAHFQQQPQDDFIIMFVQSSAQGRITEIVLSSNILFCTAVMIKPRHDLHHEFVLFVFVFFNLVIPKSRAAKSTLLDIARRVVNRVMNSHQLII